MAASTLPKLEPSLSRRMKDVYVATGADEDLDKEYGDNVGGPPKNRRAGMIPLIHARAVSRALSQ